MTPKAFDDLLQTLQARFERHRSRHPGLAWAEVRARLDTRPDALAALQWMESTGGEPDVIGREGLGDLDPGGPGPGGPDPGGTVLFCDCSAESPAGRRSLCYDQAALDDRKTHKPAGSAVEQAAAVGIRLLTEAQYHELQRLGAFDTKTSSWLDTPAALRALGGALFGDRRYDRVFIYHNGAQSYYAARGFRGLLRV